MGGSLRRLAAIIGIACGLILASQAPAQEPTVVDSETALKLCMLAPQGRAHCRIRGEIVERTSGSSEITSPIFDVTLPLAGGQFTLEWEDEACLVWDHVGGAEPANTSSAVEILSFTAPSGIGETTVRLIDACVREYRDGVADGDASTVVNGIVLQGAGASSVEFNSIGDDSIEIASSGSGTSDYAGTIKQKLPGIDRVDSDGDGLFEYAVLWDADGDGSGWVECTAKDTPDPACKASGERVYRDFVDDINAAIHGTGPSGEKMSQNGNIFLPPGVYVQWPCYDARQPAGYNDPTATDDNLHDSTSDAAYQHCVSTPDTGTSRRFATLAFMGWQGIVEGSGTDTRNPETTPGYKRDQGTYIVDDRGPRWDTGAQAGNNSWFGMSQFIRGINFGFDAGVQPNDSVPVNAGEYTSDGDSSGYGFISGDQSIDGLDGEICVCEDESCGASTDDWAQGLVAGDQIDVVGSSQTNTFTSKTVVARMRVRDVPDGTTCNGAGTTLIPLGGRVSSGTGGDYATNPPLVRQLTDGLFQVIHSRSDAFQAGATLRNVTVEPQDWWNETGGDCAGSGVWDTSGDGSQSDIDCDTQSLFGMFGSGSATVEDVVVRHWHSFAFDGNSNAGNPRIRRVRMFYGQGGPAFDFGFGWNIRDIEIWNSQFGGAVTATFGPGVIMRTLKIYNSNFTKIASLSNQNRYNFFEDLQVFSSSFGNLFTGDCGAKFNYIRNVRLSGHEDGGGTDLNGAILRVSCSDTSDPFEHNTFDTVQMTGPGQATGATLGTNAAVVFDSDSTISSNNTDAIVSNHFKGFQYVETENNVEACLFAAQDDESGSSREAGTDYSHEDVLAKNTFSQNSVTNTGTGTSARVYCACGLYDDAGNGPSHVCEDPIQGPGALNGADPIGCMNLENGSVPSVQSCL